MNNQTLQPNSESLEEVYQRASLFNGEVKSTKVGMTSKSDFVLG